ncbi:MAG: sulfotransferase [Xanthomonadales bacterium]|nr:sulfotransferase [Xanthomonadales bacterium]
MILPNFLIIGANKAGTTSLHNYLDQHPEIFMSKIKEPMYFALAGRSLATNLPQEEKVLSGGVTILQEYANLFEGAGDAIAIGEASTAYLANPSCAKLIQAVIPEVKLIAVLRDPIRRAFSNYRMYCRWGFERRSFKKCIKDELSGKNERLPQGQQYIRLGMYGGAISQYLQIFPRERVRIYLYEQFAQDSAAILKDICAFLDVSDSYNFDTNVRLHEDKPSKNFFEYINVFGSKGKLLSSDVRVLKSYYRSDIELLEKLLAIDLSVWKN